MWQHKTATRQNSALRMMNGLGERIRVAAEAVGGLDALAAQMTGISRRTLSDWANDKTEPRASSLAEICQISGVSLAWLITGEARNHFTPKVVAEVIGREARLAGDPTVAVVDPAVGSAAFFEEASSSGLPPNMIRLPLYSVEASAGPGRSAAVEEVLDEIAFHQRFLRGLGANPSRCSVIWAKGDSMTPTIPDGSVLVVDLSQFEISNGCLYVINVEGDLLVKRARRRLDASIELISDNELYPTETIQRDRLDQVQVVGRVIYFCRAP